MTPFNFKFQWVNDKGQPTGFLAKKGRIQDGVLTLDKTEIPAAVVIDADVRGSYLVLSIYTGEKGATNVVLHTSQAAAIKAELGRLGSSVWADAHRKELTEKGLGHTFRQQVCPACHAVVNLTGMEPTPQVSCRFCHTISTIGDDAEEGEAADVEKGYRLCDECGMYSKPRQFTIFYFYFLLVVYGYHTRSTWRCPGCMRGEAWKMLFGNSIFLLGVPVALVQLFRSYGGTDIGGKFPGLDKANLQARKGNIEGAIQKYQSLLQKRPVAAGVKFNIGQALMQQRRHEQAARMLEYSLADCGNYQPAANALAICYEALNEPEKLAALKKRWGTEEDEGESGRGDDGA